MCYFRKPPKIEVFIFGQTLSLSPRVTEAAGFACHFLTNSTTLWPKTNPKLFTTKCSSTLYQFPWLNLSVGGEIKEKKSPKNTQNYWKLLSLPASILAVRFDLSHLLGFEAIIHTNLLPLVSLQLDSGRRRIVQKKIRPPRLSR